MFRKVDETDEQLRTRAMDTNVIKTARSAIFRVYGMRNPHSQKIYMMQGNQRVDIGDLNEALEFIPNFGPIEPIEVLGNFQPIEFSIGGGKREE